MNKKICLTALLLSVCLLSGCSGNSGSDTHSADNTRSETVSLNEDSSKDSSMESVPETDVSVPESSAVETSSESSAAESIPESSVSESSADISKTEEVSKEESSNTAASSQPQTSKVTTTITVTETPVTPAAESSVQEEPSVQTNPEINNGDFSMFAGTYLFSSGVGGWGTSVTIHNDGTFEGKYTDTYYGSEPEVRCSEFTGKMSDITKADNYCYSAQLTELNYLTDTGKTEMKPINGVNVKHIYTGAYGLQNAKTIYFYVAETPVSAIPENMSFWMHLSSDQTTLEKNAFYNVEEEAGFIGWDY